MFLVSSVDVVPILNVSSEVTTTEILGDDYFPVNFFVSILLKTSVELIWSSVKTTKLLIKITYGINNIHFTKSLA